MDYHFVCKLSNILILKVKILKKYSKLSLKKEMEVKLHFLLKIKYHKIVRPIFINLLNGLNYFNLNLLMNGLKMNNLVNHLMMLLVIKLNLLSK